MHPNSSSDLRLLQQASSLNCGRSTLSTSCIRQLRQQPAAAISTNRSVPALLDSRFFSIRPLSDTSDIFTKTTVRVESPTSAFRSDDASSSSSSSCSSAAFDSPQSVGSSYEPKVKKQNLVESTDSVEATDKSSIKRQTTLDELLAGADPYSKDVDLQFQILYEQSVPTNRQQTSTLPKPVSEENADFRNPFSVSRIETNSKIPVSSFYKMLVSKPSSKTGSQNHAPNDCFFEKQIEKSNAIEYEIDSSTPSSPRPNVQLDLDQSIDQSSSPLRHEVSIQQKKQFWESLCQAENAEKANKTANLSTTWRGIAKSTLSVSFLAGKKENRDSISEQPSISPEKKSEKVEKIGKIGKIEKIKAKKTVSKPPKPDWQSPPKPASKPTQETTDTLVDLLEKLDLASQPAELKTPRHETGLRPNQLRPQNSENQINFLDSLQQIPISPIALFQAQSSHLTVLQKSPKTSSLNNNSELETKLSRIEGVVEKMAKAWDMLSHTAQLSCPADTFAMSTIRRNSNIFEQLSLVSQPSQNQLRPNQLSPIKLSSNKLSPNQLRPNQLSSNQLSPNQLSANSADSHWTSTELSSVLEADLTVLNQSQANKSCVSKSGCFVYGAGMMKGVVNAKNEFFISAKNAGAGYLSLAVQGSQVGDVVYLGYEYVGDHVYRVSYQTIRPGYFLFFLKWGHLNIEPFPFICYVE